MSADAEREWVLVDDPEYRGPRMAWICGCGGPYGHALKSKTLTQCPHCREIPPWLTWSHELAGRSGIDALLDFAAEFLSTEAEHRPTPESSSTNRVLSPPTPEGGAGG